MYVDFASTESTNFGLKIFEKKNKKQKTIPESPKKQNLKLCAGNYLHSIYVALGIKSNLEKAMAPHSSTLAWKIPWMEEPGRLQSMGSVRVVRD